MADKNEALKDLEIMRLREALEVAVSYVIKDMERAIKNNFGRVDNDKWACRCVDARDLVEKALSTPETYDDLMAWHKAQPCQECENLKHDLESYMKMSHAYANQQPFSDDEIFSIWKTMPIEPDLRIFARAIEKAHGIGE